MRSRRQVRPGLPGFSLALPTDSTRGEVQVQQKNKQDVNKFFIDVDDTLVSPLVTTESHSLPMRARGTFPGMALGDLSQPAKLTPSSGAAAAAVSATTPAIVNHNSSAASSTPNAAVGGGPSAAKFIHVNNTNLFVLMDGVSMFFEGKSTFTGDDDPAVMQHILKKKSCKAAAAAAAKQNGPTNQNSGSSAVDTVEEAIRGIEQNVGQNFSPLRASPNVLSFAPPSFNLDTTLPAGTTTASAAASPKSSLSVPEAFASLFSNAKRPQSVPLFGHHLAIAPVIPATPLRSPVEKNSELSSVSCLSTTPASPTLNDTAANTTTTSRGSSHNNNANNKSSSIRKGESDSRRAGSLRKKALTVDDIGLSNRSMDLDEVEILHFIGGGSQGKVYRVKLDGKLYALKRMDVKDVTEATNSIERQGRKKGLVKELNMIRFQRERPTPKHLMRMFNAVATLDDDRQQLNLLIELMSFGVEDAQKMVARIPQSELMKVTQSTFRNHMSGNNPPALQQELNSLMKQQHGSCMHVMGRKSSAVPEDWETSIERQTPMPEIILSMLAADVLRGLKELHCDYGIVHCDLKPANVLLCFSKEGFKLADFGCGCQMDPETHKVRRSGVDLGSKLYKAPERLNADQESADDATDGSEQPVEFTCKADVWSLGIMLLELGGGVHPCNAFKSDFWNYVNLLKLSKMIKPLAWSTAFCDFIVRCLYVNVNHRWSVNQLLQHPFIHRYESVPRHKLKAFMERLESDSANFQRKQQKEELEKQIFLSTSQIARDNYMKQSLSNWKKFTGFLSVAPKLEDDVTYPALQ